MNGELLSILEAIERDKGIDREILITAVEAALATAARKSLGVKEEEEVSVIIDRKTGALRVNAPGKSVSSVEFSRIAAQTAKQVIIQKIREAERDVVYSEFQSRLGSIVNGTVHRFERGDIIVELGRAEAILPKSERIPHEEYQQGDRLQGYVVEVQKTTKGHAVVLSRTHEGFIRGLFSLEVPEIAEGIVEIKGISREAGDRTKLAVHSKDEKVDCVGACVGMRGTRVKNIVRELHGEKIDIIRWHADIREFIAAALSPAKIDQIIENHITKAALILVDDDQLSLAIGKKGQNVRLASKLTGWRLEIKSKSQLARGEVTVNNLPGVSEEIAPRLQRAGFTAIEQVATSDLEALTRIEGLDDRAAEKLTLEAMRLIQMMKEAEEMAQMRARMLDDGGTSSAEQTQEDTGAQGPVEASSEGEATEQASESQMQDETSESEAEHS